MGFLRRRPDEPPDDGWPSVEDISYRIGARDRPDTVEPPEQEAPPPPVLAPRRAAPAHARRVVPAAVRRRILWRDAVAVLLLGTGVVLLAQVALQGGPATSGTSREPGVTEVAIGGSVATPVDRSGGPTLGPVVDPSLGLDASPTPIPVITSPPARPSPTPRRTPRPSVAPTATPSPTPTPPASPSPSPTPTLTPVVAEVVCGEPVAGRVTCYDESSGALAGSQEWTSVGSVVDGGDTWGFVEYQFTSGTHSVTLTVTGAGGVTDTDVTMVTIP